MLMLPSYKAVPFEVTELKATGDSWSFAGYASTFGNVDEGGDVVMRGAFKDSLLRRPKPKLLWQHDIGEPIGVVQNLREDEKGLYGEWKLSKTARGQDAYTLLKDGAVDSMSIGYIADDFEFTDDGIRKLKGVDLLEVSVVSVPMNQEALITAVKAMERLPLDAHGSRLLDDVRAFIRRYREVSELRARDGRQPGEAVRQVVTDLKALAAELEVPQAAESVPPKGLHSLTVRLEVARRQAKARGILEHAQ